MRKYRPCNRTSVLGLSLLIASTFIGGIAIGTLVWAISRIAYVPLMWPLGIGFAGFLIVGLTVEKAKSPHPFLAGLFGVLIAALAYTTYHYGEYLTFRREQTESLTAMLSQTHGDVNDRVPSQALDLLLERETRHRGFLGYLHWVAKTGVTFTSFLQYQIAETGGPAAPGLTITSGWVWLHWLIEAVLASGFGGFFAAKVARQPFCKTCQQWYRAPIPVGTVPKSYAQRFLGLLKSDSLEQAAMLISQAGGMIPGDLEVQAQTCCNCPSNDVVLLVNRIVPPQQRGIFPISVFEGLMTPGECAAFLERVRTRHSGQDWQQRAER